MAKKIYDSEKIQAIGDRIRYYTKNDKKYTTSKLPSGVDEVYNKGLADGQTADNQAVWDSGYSAGYTEAMDKTEDATAEPRDIIAGETAWVNGQKITGTIRVAEYENHQSSRVYFGAGVVNMEYSPRNGCYLKEGGTLSLRAYLSNFGNATTDDVAEGKIFTSAAGFQVVGTGKTYGAGASEGYDAGYKAGRLDALEEVRENKTFDIRGAYTVFKHPILSLKNSIINIPEDTKVYANFYDGTRYYTQAVGSIGIHNSVVIISRSESDLTIRCKNGVWSNSTGVSFPDDRYRVIVFEDILSLPEESYLDIMSWFDLDSNPYDVGREDGIDITNDATATSKDIPEGIVAYAKGERLVGTLKKATEDIELGIAPFVGFGDDASAIQMSYAPQEDIIIPSDKKVVLSAPLRAFGEATVDDVEEGKTFTSSAGLKMTGGSNRYKVGYDAGYEVGRNEGGASMGEEILNSILGGEW